MVIICHPRFKLDEVKSGRGKKGKWILAMECMSNTSKIVVSTSNRELCKQIMKVSLEIQV